MRTRWPLLLLAFVLLPGTIAGRTGTSAAPQSLTRSVQVPTPAAQAPNEAWESRKRLVAVDLTALPDRATAGAKPTAGAELGIELFDGRSIRAVFERFDPNTSGVTWVGTVPGVPESRVTLVYGGGTMAASVVLPDSAYIIRPMPIDPLNPRSASAQPLHVLSQINQGAFPPEAEPIEVVLPQRALEEAADAVMGDTADVIDVLIVYTQAAENWAGGPNGILNWINLGVSETNSAYEFSGVLQRILLVQAEKVAYTESNSFSTNLNDLRNGVGLLSSVPTLRNAYGVDLVSMIVRPTSPDACGIAFIMTSVSTAFAPSGYNVVDAPCVSPNSTLAHEFGHNMGLRHDWFMDSGQTPFTYAHGYVNTVARFRTIMSYPNSCSALGFSCTRILAFSNPDQLYLGVPMGIAGGTNASCPAGNANNMACDADERRALNNTAFTVANFRQATTDRPPLITGHPASQSVVRGQTVSLQVSATGLGPFTYQWYRGQSPSTLSPINGATSAAYVFVPGSDGVWLERWLYWVRVSNSIGPANSAAATITLLAGGSGGAQRDTRGSGEKTGRPPVLVPTSIGGTVVDTIESPAVCSDRMSMLLAATHFALRSGDADMATRVRLLLALFTLCQNRQ